MRGWKSGWPRRSVVRRLSLRTTNGATLDRSSGSPWTNRSSIRPRSRANASDLPECGVAERSSRCAAAAARSTASRCRATSSVLPLTWWASSNTTRSQPASMTASKRARLNSRTLSGSHPWRARRGLIESSEHTTWSKVAHGLIPASTGTPPAATSTNSSPKCWAISATHWSCTPLGATIRILRTRPRAFSSLMTSPASIVLPSPTSSAKRRRTGLVASARSSATT